jgi:hypothetical protein
VTAYIINFKDKAGAFATDTVNCDGSNATIVLNRWCVVPMEKFTTTYAYILNDLLVATVQATNIEGSSVVSAENTSGILTRTIPSPPPNGPTEATGTTDTQLVVNWESYSGDLSGQSPITHYELFWD